VASTGNVFPTVGANVDRAGNAAWTSPGNVVSDNATDATGVVPTDYLVTSAYGFAVPSTAVILGVTVRVEVGESGGGSSFFEAQLHSATTPTLVGSNKTSGTVNGTTKVVETLGGAADLWGATLTPAIVNAAGFGVSIWSTDTTNTLSIDFVTIAIEYAIPLGRSDETDTALALGVSRPPGLASETDTALALQGSPAGGFFSLALELGAGQAAGGTPAGRADETDAALPLGSARPAGLSTETDTALARGVSRPPGLALESDAAFALGASRPAGLSTETDAALPLGVSRPVGRSDETDTALARGASRPVGMATETDTALALAGSSGSAPGIAAETDTAFARGVSRPPGLATETDAALALAGSQSRAVGRSDETDTAFALSGSSAAGFFSLALELGAGASSNMPPGIASETDTALAPSMFVGGRPVWAWGSTKNRPGRGPLSVGRMYVARPVQGFFVSPLQSGAVGVSLEVDTAFALGSARPAGLATETDVALARGVSRPPGLSSETDASFARGVSRPPGMAAETDTALALLASGGGSPGIAVETDTALALGSSRPAGRADEVDTALALAGVSSRPVGMSVEVDTAFALVTTQSGAVGRADELDTAFALGASRPAGRSDETDVALALAGAQSRPPGIAVETDTARALGSARPPGIALEVDTALERPALGGSPGLCIEIDECFALLPLRVSGGAGGGPSSHGHGSGKPPKPPKARGGLALKERLLREFKDDEEQRAARAALPKVPERVRKAIGRVARTVATMPGPLVTTKAIERALISELEPIDVEAQARHVAWLQYLLRVQAHAARMQAEEDDDEEALALLLL
jgi:hypothetical protein